MSGLAVCGAPRNAIFSLHINLLLGKDVLLLLRGPKPTVQAGVRVSRPRASLYWYTTICRPHVDRLRVLLRLGVNTDIDSSIEAIFDGLANERDLQHRIVAALLSHVEERVYCVGSDGLLVGVVGRGLLDLA